MGPAPPPRHQDNEQELLACLQRETSPVRKAKCQIRLGRLKLLQAYDACRSDDHQHCPPLLSNYMEEMKDAWETLRSSGRDASRKPQGFKELDIALREALRTLDDLHHIVAYEDRAPIVQASEETSKLRNDVLMALFPGGQPKQSQEQKAPPPKPPAGKGHP